MVLIYNSRSLLLLFFFQLMTYMVAVSSQVLDMDSVEINSLQGLKENSYEVDNSVRQDGSFKPNENINITGTYMDASGDIKAYTVNSNDLSSSWMWGNSVDEKYAQQRKRLDEEGPPRKTIYRQQEGDINPNNQAQKSIFASPLKHRRQVLRRRRKTSRTFQLTRMGRDAELNLETEAIEKSRQFDTTIRGKYSIWRREYQNFYTDSTLKLMKDQIIMAKVYTSIARLKGYTDILELLKKHIKESQDAIGEASSDEELREGALQRAKAMGHILSEAKQSLYDCDIVARKLRAMTQSTEDNISAEKKQSAFLIQHAAKTVPKPLHCLPLQLTTDYFLKGYRTKEQPDKQKLDDPSLYHYAIFSDNVLATSVVVNSTVVNTREPEKHVFHIVTDKLNYAAMKMWFILHPPSNATVNVENIDDFKWLNSSYCSVLRQLESSRLKEYYFKFNHPTSISAGNDNLKYRNPKYLSMLNHLRFYMPEVYPKLEKILFLDDDVVVQKDLTPLWSIDMKGMVNGAVETCKESFHRFETYLNFSNPKISKNFDPQACGWAFGMNIFDLKEWKKRNITGIYHHWQDLNEDRTLWKLGSLPPGLITFYGLTYPLDRSWHVLGLGYDPAISSQDIEKAAVIHYNGNYKPWLDLVINKYKPYWSKYVKYENPHLRLCNLNQYE